MNQKVVLAGILFILASSVGTSFDISDNLLANTEAFAQESKIPDWVKKIFVWYGQSQISEDDVLNAIKFLVENDVIHLQTKDLSKDMMGSSMMENGMMKGMTTGEMSFNPDMPITIPMIDGYYNDKKVFFIHTEVSDVGMAKMMTGMVNFPTIHVSNLEDIPEENLDRVYVFTNGISGAGPYGGGPFMFQIDIFDSVPGKQGYSQFRVPYLVTWSDDSSPRLLTSVDDLLQAEANGELVIQKTQNVVHAPMIIWDDSQRQEAKHIENPFISMPEFDAQVISIDEDNYTVTLRFHPIDSMNMMN